MSTPSPEPGAARTQAQAQTRPRARYGSHAGKPQAVREPGGGISGKALAVFAVAMLVLVAVMAGQAFLRSQSRVVTAEFMTQERIDDETARLWIEVNRKNVDRDAYCIVFAVDYEHAEIGRREVVIPAGGEKLQRLAVELPTREPVASGRVYGCAQDIPFYMDTSATYLGAR